MKKVKIVLLIGLTALGGVYAGTKPKAVLIFDREASEAMTKEEKNKLVVEVALGAINTGNWEWVKKLYSPKFVQHQPGGQKKIDWEDFELGCRLAKNKLPKWDYEIEDIIAEGDKVAVRLKTVFKFEERYAGNVRKGAKIVFTEIDIFRIEGGKIVEEWCECDEGHHKEKLRTLLYYGKRE